MRPSEQFTKHVIIVVGSEHSHEHSHHDYNNIIKDPSRARCGPSSHTPVMCLFVVDLLCSSFLSLGHWIYAAVAGRQLCLRLLSQPFAAPFAMVRRTPLSVCSRRARPVSCLQ